MKNKKGFTLIELIAVIIIIGIIAILIVPSVSNYIVNTRNTSYVSHERAMSEAAESYTIECINNNGLDCDIPGPDEEKAIYLNELIENDFIDNLGDPAKSGSFCNENTSYIKIYNTGKDNYEYTACLYCSAYATENPKCVTYHGDNDAPRCKILDTYSEWTNESRQVRVGCEDDTSGCLRDEFKKTFSSTTNKGIITITDKSGNSTDCEVDVKVDKTAPTCRFEANGTEVNGWYPLGTTFTLKDYVDHESSVLTYGTGTSVHADFNKIVNQTPPRGITRIFGYVQDAAGNVGTCTVNAKIKTEFVVHYGKNNGTGTMADKHCMVDDDCILDPNAYSRSGYVFNGWNTREDGTGHAYIDRANVKNIIFSGEVTLYAQWKEVNYSITYTLNGGNVSATNPGSYTVETPTFTLNNPTKTGYRFAGWTGTGLSAATTTVTIPQGSTGNRAYTANWNVNTYTIAFAGNNNTGGSTASKGCTYDQDCVLTENGYSRTGYTFTKWKNGSNTYNDKATVKNLTATHGDTVTLTAQWSARSFTVTFNVNNGKAWTSSTCGSGYTLSGSTCSKSVTYDSTYGNMPSPTRDHYVFAGWYTDATNGTKIESSTTVAITNNQTLYAHWNAAPKATITCANKSYTGSAQTIATCSGGTVANATQTNAGDYTITCAGDASHSNADSKTCSISKVKATITCANKSYTGSAQTIATCSGGTVGNASQTNAGDYTITCAGDSNHTNADSKTCSISKVKAVIACANKAYTGSAQTIATCSGGSVGNASQTNAGDYTITCTGDSNHSNADSKTCSITKVKATITCANKAYTGNAQTIATCSGGTVGNASQTNVGNYTITCTGDSNHSNADSKTCSITKVKATITCANKNYNGNPQTIASCSGGTVGNASQTNAGDYTITCTGDSNHNNADSKTCSISKVKAVITCANKDYNGSAQTIATCSGGTVGNASQTNPGNYTITCTGDSNHTNADNKTCSITNNNVTVNCSSTGGTCNKSHETVTNGGSVEFTVIANAGYIPTNPSVSGGCSSTAITGGVKISASNVTSNKTCTVTFTRSSAIPLLGSADMTLNSPGWDNWYSSETRNGTSYTKGNCGEQDKDYHLNVATWKCVEADRVSGNGGFARAQAVVAISGGNNTKEICYWKLTSTSSLCSGTKVNTTNVSKLGSGNGVSYWATDNNRSCIPSSVTCDSTSNKNKNVAISSEGSQNYLCWYTKYSDGSISETFACIGAIKVDSTSPSFSNWTKDSYKKKHCKATITDASDGTSGSGIAKYYSCCEKNDTTNNCYKYGHFPSTGPQIEAPCNDYPYLRITIVDKANNFAGWKSAGMTCNK